MRIAALYHVPFEKLGFIEDWILSKGHILSEFHLYENPVFPLINDVDLLIIMGGSMSVYDNTKFQWIETEKKLIQQFARDRKGVLGICLGAQLIASALGSRVYPGKQKEIGWFQVRFNKNKALLDLFSQIPEEAMVFHWHGDTFDLPKGAIRLAESELTQNQGFLFDRNVLAIQFHIEMKPENISLMINNVGDELVNGPYIQQADKISEGTIYLTDNHRLLDGFLNYFEKLVK